MKGSLAGGTQLVIQGRGFDKLTTLVQIGPNAYYFNDGHNTQIEYNSISLATKPISAADSYQITVSINNLNASCQYALCNFTYSELITPVLSQISPSFINGSALVTLNGKNFGSNSSQLLIRFGK